MTPYLPFLCIAIGVSWAGFASVIAGTTIVAAGMATAVLPGHPTSLPWSKLIASGSFAAYLYGAIE